MKKIYLYIACIASFLGVMTACGDNTDFCLLHILTQDELDEIARQDSIKNEQMNSINADLKLNYTVDIMISQTLYDGASLAIDIDKIAELFEITPEELLAGIAGESGAPEVKGFAIQGTTHADVGSATNTNSPWGHWWDANGDVTTWGADAMVFAEFNPEEATFAIGQYPGHLTDGQTLEFIECLKYNEKRAAVIVTVKAKAPGEITASVVGTQELSIDVTPKSDYTQDPIRFDLAKVLSDLGISSMDEVQFIGVNEDGSYAQEAVTMNGFWYDTNGFVGAWGDNASVYTTYGDEDNDFEADQIGLGQMPNNLKAGQEVTIQYGFLANNKIEMLKIKVNVQAYQDPETRPEGQPVIIEKEITLTKKYDDTYSSVEYDVKELLRDAFKMTTYEIFSEKQNGDLKMYLNVAAEEEPEYTSDAPGYWIDAEGNPSKYADGIIWCSLGGNETNLYLYGGNHPGNCNPNGQTVKTQVIITCNGGKAIFNVTYDVTASE